MFTNKEQQEQCKYFVDVVNCRTHNKLTTIFKTEKAFGNETYMRTSFSSFCQGFEDTVLKKPIDTSLTTDLTFAYANCKDLTKIEYLSKLNTSKVTCMYGIFANDKSLENYDGIENWDVGQCEDFSYAFANSGLKSLKYFKNWKLNKAICNGTFKNTKITTLEGITDINFKGIYIAYDMFANTQLTTLKGSEGLDLSELKAAKNMFTGNIHLTDISAFSTWKLHPAMSRTVLFGNLLDNIIAKSYYNKPPKEPELIYCEEL